MSKRFMLILVVLVVLFGGLLIINRRDSTTRNNNGDSGNARGTSHFTGRGTSGVTLTEYGDFACTACYQYFPVLQSVKQKYGDRLRFQFKNFPLTEIHQNALVAARAAEAAGLQNKFWEMHDLLYQNQPTWNESTTPSQDFEGYAEQLQLNMTRFRNDMRSDAVNNVIQADRNEAQRKDYSSTPTFEINGERIDNPRSLDDFSKVIDNAIAEAGRETRPAADQERTNTQDNEDTAETESATPAPTPAPAPQTDNRERGQRGN